MAFSTGLVLAPADPAANTSTVKRMFNRSAVRLSDFKRLQDVKDSMRCFEKCLQGRNKNACSFTFEPIEWR